MNDWTADQAKGYEDYMAQLGAEVHRQFQLARKITVGSKILFFNHAAQADTWATVEKFNLSDFTNTHAVVKGGRMIFLKEIKIVHNEDATETVAILLNDRVTEILEAAKRGEGSDLELYNSYKRDEYFVVNKDSEGQYIVTVDSDDDGKAVASCTCPDFTYRSRVCKHIVATLGRWFAPLFNQLVARDVRDLTDVEISDAAYSLVMGAELAEVAADERVDAEDLRDVLRCDENGAAQCADCGEWNFVRTSGCCSGETVQPKFTCGCKLVPTPNSAARWEKCGDCERKDAAYAAGRSASAVYGAGSHAISDELTYERYEREVVANRRDEIGETMDCGCERFRDGHIDPCLNDWLRHNEPQTDEIFF